MCYENKAIKRFRQEFNSQLKLEFECSRHGKFINLKTPYRQCTLARYMIDEFNDIALANKLGQQVDIRRLSFLLYDPINNNIVQQYEKFMLTKINEYKAKHPYKKFKIKISLFKQKRR